MADEKRLSSVFQNSFIRHIHLQVPIYACICVCCGHSIVLLVISLLLLLLTHVRSQVVGDGDAAWQDECLF